MKVEYSLQSKGKEFHVLVDCPDKIKDSLDKSVEKSEAHDNLKFTLQRIVLEAFNSNAVSGNHISVDLKSFNETDNTLQYTIQNEAGNATHNIKLTGFNKKQLIQDIANKHISPVNPSLNFTNLQPVLERFSETEKPRTLFGRIKQILADFFNKILETFKFLDNLWEGITNQSAKKLKWDLNVLSEVSGTPNGEKISMHNALHYISKMLDRENEDLKSNPEIASRIRNACAVSESIQNLKDKFSAPRLNDIVENIRTSIKSLKDQDKVLIPVGYIEKDQQGDNEQDQRIEMLLEIKKAQNGTYVVTLISTDKNSVALFDREVGLDTDSQSIRREISNVSEGELLANLNTLIELQTSPTCQRSDGSEWREIFMQTIKFDQSIVIPGKMTETFKKDATVGHLSETISYLKGEFSNPEDSKRFDLSVRLRLFLDICTSNKKGLKDKNFWTLARTTTLQIASLIEQNKELLGPSNDQQGIELTKIYHKLKDVLKNLNHSLPEVADLKKISLPLFSGNIEANGALETPLLIPLATEVEGYPNIDPPFTSFDKAAPLASIKHWNKRNKGLLETGQIELAAKEGKLVVRQISFEPTYIKKLSKQEAEELATNLKFIGESLFRRCDEKGESTLIDIASLTVLNYIVYQAIKPHIPPSLPITPFMATAKKAMTELIDARLSTNDRSWLLGIKKQFEIEEITPQLKEQLENSPINSEDLGINSVISLSQFLLLAIEPKKGMPALTTLPINSLNFTQDKKAICFEGQFINNAGDPHTTSVLSKAPIYAQNLTTEISNCYATEQCCLGCIRDNCPNYAPVKDKRFLPLFLIHNFVDDYCSKTIGKSPLHRDEATALFYTQQTNQNPIYVYGKHDNKDGFSFAHGFNEEDHKIQVLNTCMVYLNHPNFFEHPELRYHFENKILGYKAFESLLSAPSLQVFEPFIYSMIKQIKKEIKVSEIGGDLDKAAYLAFILNELKEIITHSDIDHRKQESFNAIIDLNFDVMIYKLSSELVGKSDEASIKKQPLVLSLLLNNYYKKFCENSEADCFSELKNLELIVASIGRLERSEKEKEKIDPEVRDRYLTLISGLAPKIQEKIKTENTPGEFVNNILFYLNPTVSQKQLKWNTTFFPFAFAQDEAGEDYKFDLFTGKLSIGDLSKEEIPENLKKNIALKKIFGPLLDENWIILGTPPDIEGPTVKSYTHDKLPLHRIVIRKGGALSSRVTIEKIIKNQKGRDEWVTYHRFDEQDSILQGTNLAKRSHDLPPPVAALIADRNCWIDQDKKNVYVFDENNKDLYATISLKTDDGNITTVQDLYLVQENTHLLHADPKILEEFSSIEDPEYIQLTGNNNQANLVHYPRYELALSGAPLTYNLDEKGISCKAYPGFQLQPFGERPGKKDPSYGVSPIPYTFDGFHLLRKEGEEKVLIPMRQFQQEVSATNEPLQLSKPLNDSKSYTKCPLFDYKVDQETNRLIAKSGDAYAYLAYASLAQSDYGLALYYMDKAITSVGYGENYDKIFTWIRELKDNSPNASALKLRFELFQEKILEDRKIRLIRDGKLSEMAENESNSVVRLTKIADLYQKYTQAQSNRIIGEKGNDPALDLSEADEQYIKSLIQKLLVSHGDTILEENRPEHISAEEVPIPKYLTRVEKDVLGITKATHLIWAHKGNDRNSSTIGLKDPRWVIHNFRDVFNQLLTFDSKSVEFKLLEHQIRMLTQIKEKELEGFEKLTVDEKEGIEEAQYYLLKLIYSKQQVFDPTYIYHIKKALGPDELMAPLKGPTFKSARLKTVERMNAITKDWFTPEVIEDPDKALKNARTLFAFRSKDYYYSQTAQRAKALAADKKLGIFKISENAIRFIEDWQSKKLPKENFKGEFQKFLIGEIFGALAAKNFIDFDKVFKLLEAAPIKEPKQRMLKQTNSQNVNTETYNDKYQALVNSPPPSSYDETISDLENKIEAIQEPNQPQKITTPSNDQRPVLGEDPVARYKSFFSERQLNPLAVDETLFDQLATSTELASVRLAEEARNELKTALVGPLSVNITQLRAEELAKDLTQEINVVTKNLEKEKHDLLQFVERFTTPAGILAMRRLIGKQIKPSLDFLINLWRRDALTEPWQTNIFKQLGMQAMSDSVKTELDEKITKYLELSTKLKHLIKVNEQSHAYIQSCQSGPSNGGDLELAKVFYDSLLTKRCFTLDKITSPDFRDLLFLEYSQEIILRAPQLETLRDMLSNPNAVRQLRMGGGKSKVLLPMLAKRKANGANLVMLMLPEELYETNCKDLDNTNRLLFGQSMHRFDFNRKTDKSCEALKAIYTRLLSTIDSKGYLMTTKRSILGLRNAYLELLYKLNNSSENEAFAQIEQVRLMSKILNILQSKTDVIADEVDACLDVRKEVNFSLGESHKVNRVKADVGVELMQIILAATKGSQLFRLKESLQKNTQATFSPIERQNLMKALVTVYFDKKSRQLEGFNKESFIQYMLNETENRDVEEFVLHLKNTDSNLYQQLTTVKAFIERGYGVALGRIGNVNYGRDPISEVSTIPYKASNTPNVGSEFDDDIEQISFTALDYIQNGVSYKQVYQIVAKFRNKAMDELRGAEEDRVMSINDTDVGKEFQLFVEEIDPKKSLPKNLNLATVSSEKNILALVAAINSTSEGRLAFCHKLVIKEINQFSDQINSVSDDLPGIVRSFGGFTGTPWNLHTYHDKIDAKKSVGVDGDTWALMLGRDVKVHTFTYDANHPIESLINELDILGNYQAVIDTGAYLRGTNNSDFIDKSLSIARNKGKPVQAGIYFDKTGQIVKKQATDETSLPIDIAPSTDLMQTLTLYDQAHTVGADIKQDRKAKAIVTIGENTFIRDLFQAVWRLRQLHQEQRVELAISDDIKKRILPDSNREITIKDLLQFCLINEAKREADDNFRAEKEKIKGFAKRTLIGEIVSCVNKEETSDQDIRQLAQTFASNEAGLFIKARPQEEVFDQYASLKTKQDPEFILTGLKTQEASKCRKVAELLKGFNEEAGERFQDKADEIESREIKAANLFPNKVESALEEGGEIEMEAQAEVEMELELTLETETEQSVQVVSEVVIPMIQSGTAGSGNVTPLDFHKVANIVSKSDNYSGVKVLNQGVKFFDDNIYCSEVFERNLPDNPLARSQYDGGYGGGYGNVYGGVYGGVYGVRYGGGYGGGSAIPNTVSPQSIFYSNRKTVSQVLISKQGDRWTMIIPTIHEGHKGCRLFIDYAQKINTGVPIQSTLVGISKGKLIMNYKTGENRDDSLPFTSEADLKQFYTLYVQAKLFNGETEYGTEEEKSALIDWLKQKGEDFKTYFENNILAAKPKRFIDSYNQSSLFKIFHEVWKPANS